MEIEFTELTDEVEYKVLSDACVGVDGAKAERKSDVAVLHADVEDTVWNVWRGAEKVKKSAKENNNEHVVSASVAVKEAIETRFNSSY